MVIVPRMDAKKVKRIRLRLNLTQAQFAERLGVTETAISRWESDGKSHRSPRGAAVKLLEQLADEATGK